MQVVYGGGLASGADLTVADAVTGMTLLTVTNMASTAATTQWLPRRLINNAATGVASTGVFDYQAVNRQTTVTIASGGTSKTATLHLVYG
jgi:hypothetical protein